MIRNKTPIEDTCRQGRSW